MKLADRELATILAALRQVQDDRHESEDAAKDFNSGVHFHDHQALSNEEIDNLCDRLNTHPQ